MRPPMTAAADTIVRRLVADFARAPEYPADAADRRIVRIAGLDLPLRATVAIVVVTMAILLDYSRTFIPHSVQDIGRLAPALRYQALERFVLFGIVPLVIVLVAFRDSPARYGLRLGDWRRGVALIAVGCAVMAPVVLVLVTAAPDFRAYYRISSTGLGDLLITNTLDLVPTEFMIRGFLMFTLVRAIGPVGVLVATLPFVFSHLGKPEIEVFSTLFGGLVYGWLDWRTESIAWSAIAHVCIVTLLLFVAGS